MNIGEIAAQHGGRTRHVNRRSFKLWILLFSAFAIVGGGACYFAYEGAVQRYKSNLTNELEDVAKLAALQVDGEKHQALTQSSDMDSDLYRQQIKKLENVQQELPAIRYIYTIRNVDGRLYFILDPTPPGDHDNDGVDDKSYLMDPYLSEMDPVREVLRTGRAASSGILSTDQWGTFLSAFAPIKDNTGKTVAVLGVDVEESRIAEQEHRLGFVFMAAFVFSLVLGAIVSFYVATHIERWNMSPTSALNDSMLRRSNRTTILQLVLAAAAITCIAAGIYGRIVSKRDTARYSSKSIQIDNMLRLAQQLDSVSGQEQPNSDQLTVTINGLSGPEVARIQSQLKDVQNLVEHHSSQWREELNDVLSEVRDHISKLQGQQSDIGFGLVERQESFNQLFIMAALLAMGSLILVRAATVQQDQLARTAFEASKLHEEVERKNSEIEATNRGLTQALEDLQDNLEAMVQAWVKAVEAKDVYTAGHSERVMQYSTAIGRKLGLSEHDLRVLEMGTLIHDIGKIGIPDDILTKPDKLTVEEYEFVQCHPDVGYRMISSIPLFRECAPIVLWHHEKLDGSGYPDGLRGEEIPMTVRIATVADMFDAMTSTRAYRKSLPTQVALENLQKDVEKGAIDPKIVAVLAEIVNEQGVLWHPPVDDAA